MPILRNGDYELAYNEDDHPLRSQAAATLLQIPVDKAKNLPRESSNASSLNELEYKGLMKGKPPAGTQHLADTFADQKYYQGALQSYWTGMEGINKYPKKFMAGMEIEESYY